jgi:hypothetical protein
LQWFSERESKEKAAWLLLKTVLATAKVTVFAGLPLQEEHLFSLPVSSMTGRFGERALDGRRVGQTGSL